ncbi:MAG: SIMPL domain-containing protein [Planctomycetaceae bacterium]|nr:SIMPL domain-containing protein [Planctomycetaceae bacterium]
MNQRMYLTGVFAVVCLQFAIPHVCAQGMGGFGGGYNSGSREYPVTHQWINGKDDKPLNAESALSVIKISGTAELRVVPTQIRVVLAFTSQADTASECREMISKQIADVVKDWRSQNIPDGDIVEDFISVLPKFEWGFVEEFRGRDDVEVQKQSGYRMQINLHVAVKTEAEAMAAIDSALRHGHAEVVTFDYWSDKLDEVKENARSQAVAAARKKADLLLSVLEQRPPAINIQEATEVFFPNTLYMTYENVLEEEIQDTRSGRVYVKAFRPRMTFFHGLSSRADVRPTTLPMRPDIAVVSTVTIYYRSPAQGNAVPGSQANGYW